MGHRVSSKQAYLDLQTRLDRNVTGAPSSPTFIKILKLLYSPREAELAAHLPTIPTSLETLARQLGVPAPELDKQLTAMAQRGVVIDLSRDEKRYFALPPVVIGFFEYTFMRSRDDVPLAELAKLFDAYMHEDDSFARSVFQGQTQLGRALIREEVLPENDYTEVLDWERASQVIGEASALSVSLCSCRHKAMHLDKACARPMETCMTLNMGAETMIRMGNARRITRAEAFDILAQSKEAGLAQVADNVQSEPSYICNCCGCCCGMMQAIRTFDLRHAIVTSNWLMHVDRATCKGCAKCVKACPVNAIRLVVQKVDGKNRGWVEVDETLCLGCGVCAATCDKGSITFQPRAQRVYTPETMYDRVIAMALERGKLADLIFAQPEKLSHRALKRIIQVVEKSPPFQAALAIAPLKSAFLDGIVRAAKATGS
jgi:ferredoxin